MSTPASLSMNKIVSGLGIDENDQIITIRENGHSDANFILTHLIQHAFSKSNKVCLVLLHNTIGHYQNVGKKLGYDLLKKVDEGKAFVIDVLKEGSLSENIAKDLYSQILKAVNTNSVKDNFYIFIDDLSHFADLGASLQDTTQFINRCVNLDGVKVVINMHVGSSTDRYVCNALDHASDLVIDVSSLKTGRSLDVTGVVTIKRNGIETTDTSFRQTTFHYRTLDRDIKLFAPGDCILNLYK